MHVLHVLQTHTPMSPDQLVVFPMTMDVKGLVVSVLLDPTDINQLVRCVLLEPFPIWPTRTLVWSVLRMSSQLDLVKCIAKRVHFSCQHTLDLASVVLLGGALVSW